jgi:hypothetical protein
LLSANEEKGNHILTAFMGFIAPKGDAANSSGHAIFTPTITGGKGWGNFVVDSTLDVSFPDGGEDRLGMPLAFNTAGISGMIVTVEINDAQEPAAPIIPSFLFQNPRNMSEPE